MRKHNSKESTKYEEASTRIVNVPDDVIKQIRIKTIEEFQHKLKKHYTEYNIDCVLEDTNFYSYPLACYYLEDYIDEIATELKSLDICDGEILPM